jgi:sucrose-6-phosphate hydrolase SacC (GH32 family)
MFRLPGAWMWDFWLADDGRRYHLFFLFASRDLGDERERHHRAAIGHAVSDDLRTWTRAGDVVAAAAPPAFDDLATWTGSVVRAADGRWWLFYTGVTLVDDKIRQTIGAATSTDLEIWYKDPASPLVTADTRWYERLGGGDWHEEAWRDPWVLQDPGGDGWHMLITARANSGPDDDRGVIGHAYSPDLQRWEVHPPLSKPGSGFGHIECPQLASVDGRQVLVFSCLDLQFSAARRASGATGGIPSAPTDSPTGPFDIAAARPLTSDAFYCGRIIQDRSGQPMLLAFHHYDEARQFLGELSDPMPVAWEDGELKVTRAVEA